MKQWCSWHPDRGWGKWLPVVFIALHLVSSDVRADYLEIRQFKVLVDGKEVGSNQLRIIDRADGTTHVTNSANVRAKFIITFTFRFDGTEVWKNYQLLQLDGQCDNNGKKTMIQAVLDPQVEALRLKVDGREQPVRPKVWTTSYWKLPEPAYFNREISVLNADKGTVDHGKLQYIGTEQLPLLGKQETCYRFRVTDVNNPIDLWFDIYHRLVRQEFVRLGHRTVIELVNVERQTDAR